ncbi:hypothetical protein BU26DRAFT_563965 [Trematosphaeria pertusa]|uniref:Uncharacterized protein n=1 Tax=Trematosphaeria pertusa TaxID=390896 RepID=A0A6A6II42_9PLEO|nr:uncharacterized protein BU26DRAFT_563965 [Trematosphaeria pertusa]KAF2250081.1 hypothetical protein BU26DRAFT_563965 [Trematosphaeria pertusa]
MAGRKRRRASSPDPDPLMSRQWQRKWAGNRSSSELYDSPTPERREAWYERAKEHKARLCELVTDRKFKAEPEFIEGIIWIANLLRPQADVPYGGERFSWAAGGCLHYMRQLLYHFHLWININLCITVSYLFCLQNSLFHLEINLDFFKTLLRHYTNIPPCLFLKMSYPTHSISHGATESSEPGTSGGEMAFPLSAEYASSCPSPSPPMPLRNSPAFITTNACTPSSSTIYRVLETLKYVLSIQTTVGRQRTDARSLYLWNVVAPFVRVASSSEDLEGGLGMSAQNVPTIWILGWDCRISARNKSSGLRLCACLNNMLQSVGPASSQVDVGRCSDLERLRRGYLSLRRTYT